MQQSVGSDAICPLCRQRNDCALAKGQPIAVCWCQQQAFAPKSGLSQAVLAQTDLSGKNCICPCCAAALLQEHNSGISRLD